jgi:thioredoxin-like negative regulator of GroEL
MAPMVHGLEARYSGKIKFVYLDADDPATQAFQRQLGFRYQPEFYLLNAEGQVLSQWTGPVTEAQFEAEFAARLVP